jgi:hypothetical protein
VPRENLFTQRHRARRRGRQRNGRQALQARHVVVEQAAVLHNPTGDLPLALREYGERNFLAAAHAVDDGKIRRREDTEVLTVFAVDALEVFGDDEPDAGAALGVRRLLARRTLAAPLAADRHGKAAAPDAPAADRKLIATLEAEVGKLTQGLVVVVADVGGRDLVRGDVVAQLGGDRPLQVVSLELASHQIGIFGQEQNSACEAHTIRQHVHRSGAQHIEHARKITPC